MDETVLDLVEFPPRNDDPELEEMLARNRFVLRMERRLLWWPVCWSEFVKPPD